MPADPPLQGACLFLGSPVALLTFAPVVGSRWGGTVVGGSSPSCRSFAAEAQTALLEPDFVKPGVFPLLLLIFVYKTRGSHQSPQRLCQASLWHTPHFP